MEKREVKFVRLFPSEGKKLKIVTNNRYYRDDEPMPWYCDDGHIIPEDELVSMEDVSVAEWEEARKGYYNTVRCF